MLAPAAAGSVLELGDAFHRSGFAFSFFGKFLLLPLSLVLALRQAAIRSLLSASALIPMAQMKPTSSRPTAVMILRWSLPAASRA